MKMGLAILVRILDEVVCISFRATALVRVSSMGEIDLSKNYLYSIRL